MPWDPTSPPPLASIPFSQVFPANLYKRDMFHVIKHGLGRESAASVLLLLCTMTYFDWPGETKNLPDRLHRAYMTFKMVFDSWQNTITQKLHEGQLACHRFSFPVSWREGVRHYHGVDISPVFSETLQTRNERWE